MKTTTARLLLACAAILCMALHAASGQKIFAAEPAGAPNLTLSASDAMAAPQNSTTRNTTTAPKAGETVTINGVTYTTFPIPPIEPAPDHREAQTWIVYAFMGALFVTILLLAVFSH